MLRLRMLLFIFFASSLLALGQDTNASAQADLNVLYGFFSIQRDVWTEIKALRGSDPSAADRLETAAAVRLGVNVATFEQIAEVSSTTMTKLNAINQESQRFLEPYLRQRKTPDVVAMEGFRDRRVAELKAGYARLEQSLPPPTVTSLKRYMNDIIRKNMTIGGRQP